VLLLTCLIAAVFSDAVWERAQNWFKGLGEKRSGTKANARTKETVKTPRSGKRKAEEEGGLCVNKFWQFLDDLSCAQRTKL
jgi:hypothetical protein